MQRACSSESAQSSNKGPRGDATEVRSRVLRVHLAGAEAEQLRLSSPAIQSVILPAFGYVLESLLGTTAKRETHRSLGRGKLRAG